MRLSTVSGPKHMKVRFLVPILIALCATFVPAFAQPTQEQINELGKYIRDNYDKREVMIPMRDGVKLFTVIYSPEKKSQKYPILMQRTPYAVGPYGKDRFKQVLGP